MTADDVIEAISGPLRVASLSYPVVWPNVRSEASLPRAEIVFLLGPPRRLTIGANHHEIVGEMRVACLSRTGEGQSAALILANEIAALYEPDQEYAAGQGRVLIRQRPQVSGGFPDDAAWRVPVRVFFRALS